MALALRMLNPITGEWTDLPAGFKVHGSTPPGRAPRTAHTHQSGEDDSSQDCAGGCGHTVGDCHCDWCRRCERHYDDCDCCNDCDSTRGDCTCCRDCKRTRERCNCARCDHCREKTRHCECEHCDNCSAHVDDCECGHCGRCGELLSDCDCDRCEHCGDVVAECGCNFCVKCGALEGQCVCSKDCVACGCPIDTQLEECRRPLSCACHLGNQYDAHGHLTWTQIEPASVMVVGSPPAHICLVCLHVRGTEEGQCGGHAVEVPP